MKYFIDWENVGPHGLSGVSQLHKEDAVVIFFSDHSPKLPIASLKELADTTAKIKWRFIEQTGSNALDFVIATEVGFAMAKDKKENITIISKDNGYYSIVLYWQKRGRQIALRDTVEQSRKGRKKELKKINKELKKPAVKEEKETIVVVADKEKLKETKPEIAKAVKRPPKNTHRSHRPYHAKKRAVYHKQG